MTTQNSAENPLAQASPELIQAVRDEEQLRLIRIGLYISGGVTLIFSTFLIFHTLFFTGMGIALLVNPDSFNDHHSSYTNNPPPAAIFLVFGLGMGLFMLLGWIFGGLQLWAGNCLGKHKNRLLIVIVSALNCFFIPWGTVLGIAALVVLNRPTIQALFAKSLPAS